jgi:dihydroxyacetone kinase
MTDTTHNITPAQFITLLNRIGEAIEAEKGWLSDLDGVIGDGDHGVTMSIGWNAVRDALAGIGTDKGFADICNAAAKAFLNAVGASAGPLYATAFMRGGGALKGKETLDAAAMVGFIEGAAQGIVDRGKAEPGDKTMVDAWMPAVAAAKAALADGKSLADCVRAAASGAEAGMKATADMTAKKGRSSKLGERSLGHMDPGAASTFITLRSLAQGVADLTN